MAQTKVIKFKIDESILLPRLFNETGKGYYFFCKYAMMGINRSLRKLSKTGGRSFSQLRRWSKKNQWVKRAQGYDKAFLQWELRQIREEAIEARKRRIKQQMLRQQTGRKRIQAISTDGQDFKDVLSVETALKMIDSGEKGERIEYGEIDEALQESNNANISLSIDKSGGVVESIKVGINQKALLKEKFLEASPEAQRNFIHALRGILPQNKLSF
ncbi:MAG: hypothetical protein K8T10_20020 [Candidatus Eremiobacteraeota bacterium]|nr:hypothetical protein [Candidatus Eremiobacteraeota bacterium]